MSWYEQQRFETYQMESWPRALRALELIWPQVENADDGSRDRLLSDRAFDESQVAGQRLYMNAYVQLSAAREHVLALLGLLEHHGASPMAPWTLLRPVLLGAFHALWCLDPDDGEERRRRGLRIEVINYDQRIKWLSEYLASPGISATIAEEIARMRASSGSVYRKEADALGLDWGMAKRSVDVAGEIKKLKHVIGIDGVGPAHYAATWRSLSGFSHGYAYSMLAHSELQAEIPIPGGSMVTATIRHDAFEMQGQLAMYLLWEACRLFVKRSSRR